MKITMDTLLKKQSIVLPKFFFNGENKKHFYLNPFLYFCTPQMVVVAQLVRASDCGSEGRRFEPGHPPKALQ